MCVCVCVFLVYLRGQIDGEMESTDGEKSERNRAVFCQENNSGVSRDPEDHQSAITHRATQYIHASHDCCRIQ